MPTLPDKLPEESARAYDAFVRYCSMGVGRSTAKLQQEIGKGKRLLDEWSSRYRWQERVAVYDQVVARAVLEDAANAYRRDLAEHRDRYRKAGKDLAMVAMAVVGKLAQAVQDDSLRISPAALGQAARALAMAADLEAHALGIDALLPQLTSNADDDHSE